MSGHVDEFFSDIGYTCAEWVGVAESETRLGIFTAAGKPEIKIVFCLDAINSEKTLESNRNCF